MSGMRMGNHFENEYLEKPKTLSRRNVSIIKSILSENINTPNSSRVNEIISEYLRSKKYLEFEHCRITQNDDKWLRVEIILGNWKGSEGLTKRTNYIFEQRHPLNPSPKTHDEPRT